jgi:hypothetical protein
VDARSTYAVQYAPMSGHPLSGAERLPLERSRSLARPPIPLAPPGGRGWLILLFCSLLEYFALDRRPIKYSMSGLLRTKISASQSKQTILAEVRSIMIEGSRVLVEGSRVLVDGSRVLIEGSWRAQDS